MTELATQELDLGPVKPGLLAVTSHTEDNQMRGKHARAAANRRAAADAEATEAAYQRRIVKLTEERDAARSERDAAKADWQKEVRILRAQLAEGTSPRVEALTRELERVREERDRLKRDKADKMKLWEAAFERMHAHFMREHGMTGAEAVDAMTSQVLAVASHVTSGREQQFADRFGVEAMLMLRKARGQ